MRSPASEILEIVRTVETSPLPVRKTLEEIRIPKSTLQVWFDRYPTDGLEALEDHRPGPQVVARSPHRMKPSSSVSAQASVFSIGSPCIWRTTIFGMVPCT